MTVCSGGMASRLNSKSGGKDGGKDEEDPVARAKRLELFGSERVQQRDAEESKKGVKAAPVLKSNVGKQSQAAAAGASTSGGATDGATDGDDDAGTRPREDSAERKAREEEEAFNAEHAKLSRFALGELDITTEDIDFEEVDDDLEKFQQDHLVAEALQKGVDLRQYSRQIEADLKIAEHHCLDDYLRESDQLSSLHVQIKTCDTILERMQKMLGTFQGDLGTISDEIKTLRDKSMTMSVKLKNRTAAEERLSGVVGGMFVSPELEKSITEGAVNEHYVKHLEELNARLKGLATAELAGNVRATSDVRPLAERLKLKAVSRVRHYLLDRFHRLKKPGTNIQIKQKLLLKAKYLYHFLSLSHAPAGDPLRTPQAGGPQALARGGSVSNLGAGGAATDLSRSGSRPSLVVPASPSAASKPTAAPAGVKSPTAASSPSASSASAASAPKDVASDIAGEIRQNYVDTMSKIYHAKFKAYLVAMKKLQSDYVITKTDTLGMEESAFGASSGGLFSSLTSKKAAPVTNPSPNDAKANQPSTLAEHMKRLFTLSHQRDATVFGELTKDYIIAHVAAQAGARFSYERVFRSAQRLLMDSALTEWAFIGEFFGTSQRKRKYGRLPVESDKPIKKTVAKPAPTAAATQAVPFTAATGGLATPNASDSDRDEDGSKAAAVLAAAASNPFLNPGGAPPSSSAAPNTSGAAPPANNGAAAAATAAAAAKSNANEKDNKKESTATPTATATVSVTKPKKSGGDDDDDEDGSGEKDDKDDTDEHDAVDPNEPAHDSPAARHSVEQVMFTRVFAPTLSLFLENVEDHLFTCWDAIGLLLLIRIVCQHNRMMQMRRVHCLDAFFDRLNMLLWPRFKIVLDLHLESIKSLKAATPGKGRAATAPHYVSARYGEFSSAIITLNAEYQDDILIHTMRRVRAEVDKLLLRSASKITVAKLQSVYLINNYNAIKSIVDLRVGKGAADAGRPVAAPPGSGGLIEEIAFFDGLAQTQVMLYVEQELSEKFSRLIAFVKETELMIGALIAAEQRKRRSSLGGGAAAAAQAAAATAGAASGSKPADAKTAGGGDAKSVATATAAAGTAASGTAAAASASGKEVEIDVSAKIDAVAIESIARHFTKTWREGIEQITASVNQNFTTPGDAASEKVATEILKQILVQLVLYYKRFDDLLQRRFARPPAPAFTREIVQLRALMFEVQKFANRDQQQR